jgi:hypothetical protein
MGNMLALQFLEFVIEPEPGNASDENHNEVKRLRAKADFQRRLSWPCQAPHNHVMNPFSHAASPIRVKFSRCDEN